MDTYIFLRELADSWALLALFIFLAFVWFWAFRPGSRDLHDDAANVIFRHEDGPVNDTTKGPEAQNE
ncbi:cytochrome c oxidase subunit 4 [Octadecabacter antarcticus 307]|uniref:Cytochrome c oxidase subunit 4 n=1 Tax=Octadecabacter antarcticus 307 TaxID=391626 RepID=M9R798_9RHOB|nr:cbb3-type cytochrome c oxidase subunit 3 [Octadecabacter antarcticus]AGI66206.1 cytochrome c oxidase subunit 4 [Octadecabacter antarcticus 307]